MSQVEELLSDCERQPCEVWTRVMGYFRPVNHFNEGKKSEFVERVWFSESKIQTSHRKKDAFSRVA